ncbi:MAG: CapA family protein [Myxococcales bacterium]|nr:CapA family protein [Myxococcales bacterium]
MVRTTRSVAFACALGGCALAAPPEPHRPTPAAPEDARLELPAARPKLAPATEPARAPTPTEPARAPAPADVVVLHAGGDVTYPFGYTPDRAFLAAGAGLFSDLAPLLARGDLAFANLEGAFSDRMASDPETGILVTPRARLRWVVDAGFDLFSVANNHSLNAGLDGLADTVRAVRALATPARPLYTAGGAASDDEDAGAPTFIELPGKPGRLAFVAFAPARFHRVDWAGSPTALARISAAAAEAGAVIVSVHDGEEYAHVPSAALAARYRGFVDAGARVVLGHHPHVAQGIERYRGGVIFYSLGNLSFGTLTSRTQTRDAILYGLLAEVTLRAGALADVRAYPLYTGNSEPLVAGGAKLAPRFCHPQLLSGAFLADAAEHLDAWSRAVPGSGPVRLEVEQGAVVVRAP